MFDPGRSTGRLRACPFFGAWRALLCGEVLDWGPDGIRGWSVFFARWMVQANCTYYGRSLFLRSQAGLNMPCCHSSTVRGYVSFADKRMPGKAMERGA